MGRVQTSMSARDKTKKKPHSSPTSHKILVKKTIEKQTEQHSNVL